MDSVIELQRQTHEEVERLEMTLASILSQQTNQHNIKLANEHRAKDILARIDQRMLTLRELYDDNDGVRRHETELLDVPDGAGSADELSEFYTRLNKIKDFHRKYPDTASDPFAVELNGILGQEKTEDDQEDPISLLFSGEESYGRYLDLYANHAQYNNLKNIDKRVPYLQYLDILIASKEGPVHRDLPKAARNHKDYESYLSSLHSYLLSYTKRTQPLVDVDAQQAEADKEFEKLWEQGQIANWEDIAPKSHEVTGGLWCVACQKLYSKQTVYDAHLKSKKHLSKASGRTGSDTAVNGTPTGQENGAGSTLATRQRPKSYNSARLTALLQPLLQGLLHILADTKANVERRFSLTSRERELEQDAPVPAAPPAANGTAGGDEEEEEERIYNPLKLPLGWDGKPIPYWLFKLHGLGVEYRCEICSDGVYMGRKNFDRHFQESRHAFGMRALGLPNTKHFHEITRIEDALALAEKLKQEGKQEIFQNETMEELEDDDGNVYNRKTYEDLKKQGII